MKEHLDHLQKIFDVLKKNNISINSKKAFIEYSSINFLRQHVNSLSFVIDEQKLKAIVKFVFSTTSRQFEIYLSLTKWFRNYIENYAAKFKSLQDRKTLLLKDSLKSNNARRFYSFKIKILKLSILETAFFQAIQRALFKSIFLSHFNSNRQLYVDLNFSKKEEIEIMMYHVRDDKISAKYSVRRNVQFVLFLSRFLISVENRYWSIELKIAELVWILRKIRHLIDFFKQSTIIYIDHEAFLSIAKQITLSTFFTDKFNLRLIRASDYIQRFDLDIRHKSEKLHIVFDALSRLFISDAISKPARIDYDEFDALHVKVMFTAFLIEIDDNFRKRIIDEYVKNQDWRKIIKVLDNVDKDQTKISFIRENDVIFKKKIDDTSFVSRRICISHSAIKNILSMTYDSDHTNFDRTYEKVISD